MGRATVPVKPPKPVTSAVRKEKKYAVARSSGSLNTRRRRTRARTAPLVQGGRPRHPGGRAAATATRKFATGSDHNPHGPGPPCAVPHRCWAKAGQGRAAGPWPAKSTKVRTRSARAIGHGRTFEICQICLQTLRCSTGRCGRQQALNWNQSMDWHALVPPRAWCEEK